MDRTDRNEDKPSRIESHQNPPSVIPPLRHRVVADFVYFIRCEQFVKIGYSSNPRYRAHSFSTTNPFECRLIGIVKGGRGLERQLQVKYSAHRHRDEWFRLTPELQTEIAALCGDWSDLDRKPGGWAAAAREMSQKLHDMYEQRG